MDFKGYFRKKAIALKRNFYTVPFILNIVALVIITCAIYVHSEVAQIIETSNAANDFMKLMNDLNAFFIFIITLFAILAVVSYIKYMGRVKNYFMLAVYFVLSISQIVLEAIFLVGLDNRYASDKFRLLENPGDVELTNTISLEANSIFLVYLHFVVLGLAIVVSAVAPFIQKKLKQIKFKRMGDSESNEAKPVEE